MEEFEGKSVRKRTTCMNIQHFTLTFYAFTKMISLPSFCEKSTGSGKKLATNYGISYKVNIRITRYNSNLSAHAYLLINNIGISLLVYARGFEALHAR